MILKVLLNNYGLQILVKEFECQRSQRPVAVEAFTIMCKVIISCPTNFIFNVIFIR
jgi:hypothetical protein